MFKGRLTKLPKNRQYTYHPRYWNPKKGRTGGTPEKSRIAKKGRCQCYQGTYFKWLQERL
jgi:hypothetical protein